MTTTNPNKTTPTKVSYEATRDLAVEDGFLCRSAYEDNGSKADNTQHVQFRDVIHVYFVDHDGPKTIGSFEVVGPNRHPHGHRFGKGVQGTALFEVKDPDFERLLGSLPGNQGYEPDPVLKKMTGWVLVPVLGATTPAFEDAPFRGQMTLVKR